LPLNVFVEYSVEFVNIKGFFDIPVKAKPAVLLMDIAATADNQKDFVIWKVC